MAKIKYTKNELKKQKDQLKRFKRYLPTLVLKKQLLQMEIRQVEVQINEKNRQRDRINADLMRWVHVFGENLDLAELIKVKETDLETTNIAGVDIPVFNAVIYEDMPYDLMFYPLWVDAGVQKLNLLY